MASYDGIIEEPLEIADRSSIYGLATRTVTVNGRGILRLYGILVGDLVVQPGGMAFIYGTVDGTAVNNGGAIEIHGTVNRVAGSTPAKLEPGAVVRRQ